MKRKSIRLAPWLTALALTTLCALAGCAAEKKTSRFFWPLPPEQPRMEFVGTYSGEADLPVTGWRAFKRATLGLDNDSVLRAPSSVTANNRGEVFVAMPSWGKIKVIDFNRLTFSDYSAELSGKPYGLATDSLGNLYVADHESHAINVYSPERQPRATFGAEVLKRPVRIALNERLGRIYVSDPGRQQVVVFSLDGQLLSTIGAASAMRSESDGEFNVPAGIAIDRENRLFVCDQLNARIQVFDADGKFLYKFGERGSRDWQFESPRDLAFDSENNLWIVDFRKSVLLTYSPAGEWLLATRGPGTTRSPLGFATPTALFINDQDRIHIVDSFNNRLSVWQYISAAYLAAHPLPADWMSGGVIEEAMHSIDPLISPVPQPVAPNEAPAPR